jgi:hypothetical protein
MSRSVANARTTAMSTIGVIPMAFAPSSSVTSTAAETGSGRIAAVAAAMPAAIAGPMPYPGRPLSSAPAAAPRNSAGKIGPPRSVASDTAYARPFSASSATSAQTPGVSSDAVNVPSASCPERTTSTGERPVSSEYAPAAAAVTAAAPIAMSAGRRAAWGTSRRPRW